MTARAAKPSPSTFLSDVELAEHLGVAPATLRDWRRDKTGPPFYKIGGAVRYAQADVDSWLTARRVVPANAR